MAGILRKIPLFYKIMILTMALVLSVLSIAGFFVLRDVAAEERSDLGRRALDIGRLVASVPAVQNAILSEYPSAVLQPIAERWRQATGAAFIVIANMDQIRLTHPIPGNVGTPRSDLYQDPVIRDEEYVYEGKGSLAPSLRANVPVYAADGSNRQIGIVSVGFYMDDLQSMVRSHIRELLYAFLLALVASVAGALLMARNIKQAIFGLEPYEIATLLKERVATLEAIREGVVAVDVQGRIRLMNNEAALLLGLSGEQAVGIPIRDVFPDNRLDEVMSSGQASCDQEQRVGDTIILSHSVPIVVDNQVVGAVISFRDRTEISRLAEELTGVHRFVDLMRAQTHEFKNKMHTIAGLIQLGHYDQAVDLIVDSYSQQQGMLEQVRGKIKDSVTFGLIIGKCSRARERDIEFIVTPDTSFHSLPGRLTSGDMVIILGNLLENAIEAAGQAEQKQIILDIADDDEGVCIRVTNTGPGIAAELGNRIFQRGITTKGSSRGYGLALAAEKIQINKGSITYHNLDAGGVEFKVFLPRE
ncbi:MAG TPA: sensor histidine kinase [Patescibacteria group bacterium]|nr:sensor histidine kinase [Patescibacteria group bacterium]